MEKSDMSDIINRVLIYIKVNNELIDEYLLKIKDSSNEKEIDKLYKLIKICKKSIAESEKKLAEFDLLKNNSR